MAKAEREEGLDGAMFLTSISLQNFRNYKTLDFNFSSPLVILIGENAQGKTNFLESIFFLATTKGTRAEKDEELISEGESVLRVFGQVKSQSSETLDEVTELEIIMQRIEDRLAKKIKVNGIPRRVMDYTNNLVVIIFAPEDINLVTGSPSLRRNHLDTVLSQIDRNYKKTLSNYENVVVRKNRVLKMIQEGNARVDELDFWNREQLEFGTKLNQMRQEFFDYINSSPRSFGEFKYNYLPNLILIERQKEYLAREIASGNSLIGPHRDDFNFFLGEKDLSKYGSRGEQRTSVLDLKVSEIDYIETKIGERPLLLLDDIFSELDDAHEKHVIELARKQQTIISAVELDVHLQEVFKGVGVEVFNVDKGIISK